MPTENPKISAYIPKVVYERFLEFKAERNLTFSQATVEILAEYFGVNLADSSTNKYTGGLLDRIGQLERLVADLKQSYVDLSDKVDSIQSTGRLPENGLNDNSTDIYSEPLINLLTESPNKISDIGLECELPTELLSDSPRNDEPASDSSLYSELLSRLPIQLGLESIGDKGVTSISTDELLSELPIDIELQPLKVSALAKHLGLSDAMLHKVRKYDINKQIEYTSSKSPEKRSWVFSDSAKLFYPLRISK